MCEYYLVASHFFQTNENIDIVFINNENQSSNYCILTLQFTYLYYKYVDYDNLFVIYLIFQQHLKDTLSFRIVILAKIILFKLNLNRCCFHWKFLSFRCIVQCYSSNV